MSGKTSNKQTIAKPNYWYAIISMALILFTLGIFGWAILQGKQLIETLQSKIILLVEIEENADKVEIDGLGNTLKAMDFIKPNSLTFVSKEEIALEMKTEMGDDFQDLNMENPFLNMYNFHLKSNFLQADSLNNIQQRLSTLNHVKGVYYKGNLIEKISKNVKKLSYIALALSLFFIFVAILLIHNTIRLALYANRILIKNMQLVGATWGFISKPYLWRSAFHGLLSSMIALLGLFLVAKGLQHQLPEIIIDDKHLYIGALSLTGIGILISIISTYFVVRKYLRANVDDLY